MSRELRITLQRKDLRRNAARRLNEPAAVVTTQFDRAADGSRSAADGPFKASAVRLVVVLHISW